MAKLAMANHCSADSAIDLLLHLFSGKLSSRAAVAALCSPHFSSSPLLLLFSQILAQSWCRVACASAQGYSVRNKDYETFHAIILVVYS